MKTKKYKTAAHKRGYGIEVASLAKDICDATTASAMAIAWSWQGWAR